MLGSLVFVLSAFLLSVGAQDCGAPPKMPPQDCCPGSCPSSMNPALFTECGMTGEPSLATPPSCDTVNCVLKKVNLLTPDGKFVDKATALSTLDSQYTADFKAFLGPAYDACIALESKGPCGLGSVMMCMKGFMIKNCPASVAVNSPDCAATKAYFEKCVAKM